MNFIKETLAKSVVQSRICDIAKKEGMPPEMVYAVIDCSKPNGDFKIWLYDKRNMAKPVREIKLSELL